MPLRAFLVLPLAFIVGAGTPAAAEAPAPSAYRQAVDDTYRLVRNASPTDVESARRAASVLEQGTGTTQPEILADLQGRPPDFADATNRLHALLDALDHPAATQDAAQAQQQLHDVLAMHRYDALHRPPSTLDRFLQWLHDRWNDLLNLLFGHGGPRPPDWAFYLAGAIIVAGVAVIIFRSTRGRFTEGVMVAGNDGPWAPADYFAEADRLAAAGNRVGAIRALCAGVAATLTGEQTWEGSPLTVREIFQRAPDPARLRPLLTPFEAAVYGGRDIDPETYEQAAQVAAPFRQTPARVDRAA